MERARAVWPAGRPVISASRIRVLASAAGQVIGAEDMFGKAGFPIVTLVAAICAVFGARATAAAPAPTTLIRDVAVFDGARSIGRHDVLLAGGRIAAIDFKGKPAAGTVIVEGKGRTLLPGLIDSHVHAFQALDIPLLFGVTTQLDMFMDIKGARETKARMARGENTAAADLYTAGTLATAPHGHGTEYGIAIPTLTTPGEAEAWVTARIAEGSDYIKIIDEPGTTVGRALPTLDVPTIRALVAAAHRHGKLAVVHAESLATANDSVNAGADGLMHLFIDTDGGEAFAHLAKAHHVFVTPTYTVFEGFFGRAGGAILLRRNPDFATLLTKAATATLHQSFGQDRSAILDQREAANIMALRRAGVPLLAGTDSGNPGTWYGASLHRELDLLVKAGLTPAEALTAATAAPAKAFRLADRGRIARGLVADVLLVEGDPTVDIGAVHHIVDVWKDGVSAAPLRAAQRAKVAAELAQAGAPAMLLPADGRIGLFSNAGGKTVLAAPFGVGWSPTTDAIMAGKSHIDLAVAGAAPDGQPALVMTGALTPDFAFPWAGVGFMPGAKPFAPINLSSATAITFWTRGEGAAFAVLGFSAAAQRPASAAFPVGADWKQVTIPFDEIKGFDPRAATMLAIIATTQPGPFRLEIADVRLVGR